MDLREAGPAEREVVTLGDEGGELGGASEPPLGLHEVVLAPRRVAPQREDVLDPGRGDPVQGRAEAFAGLPDAAQVRHHLQPQLLLQDAGDLDRALAGGAPRPVGDRDEIGLQLTQRAGRLQQLCLRLLGLRREELDREDRSPGAEDLVYSHPLRLASPGSRDRLRPRDGPPPLPESISGGNPPSLLATGPPRGRRPSPDRALGWPCNREREGHRRAKRPTHSTGTHRALFG